MENINLVLQNYLLLVIIVLLALVIMLYVMYKGQKKELQALKDMTFLPRAIMLTGMNF